MQCTIALIGHVHFLDRRLSSFPKMEVGRDVVRDSRRDERSRGNLNSSTHQGRYHGEGRDVYWIIIGRTVRLYRFPDANEPFCTNVLGATWTRSRILLVALFEFVINAVICGILELLASRLSWSSGVWGIVSIDCRMDDIYISFPSLKSGLYIFFPEKLLNIIYQVVIDCISRCEWFFYIWIVGKIESFAIESIN